MNNITISKIRKNSFTLAPLIIGSLTLGLGFLISVINTHRQYFPIEFSAKEDKERESLGMEKYFFTARRNITTNKMDYQSMLAADIADRAMTSVRKSHGVTTIPNFKWVSMGPTNTGGHTNSILIDNTDPTHQTIFAGGITGGIWKSTNSGTTWGNTSTTISYSTEDTMANMNINCIAQDSKGVLYAGTGDGFTIGGSSEFSSGELGDGIFKSIDDGRTWRLLPSTKPTPIDASNVTWAYTNRIAIRPDSFQVIYAGTTTGLMVSHDSGATWNYAINSANSSKLNGNTLDVKISADGSVVVACENGNGWYCYPQTGNSNAFTQMKSTGAGYIQNNNQRIEFAISPTDANRIYASVINGYDPSSGFGGDTKSGIFMTITGKTNGGYWYDIGKGGSRAFDPYSEPGPFVFDQATYDNALGVFPSNEAQLLVGGIFLWEWSGANLSDTVGSWNEITHTNPYYAGDPLWINPDQHAIAFDPNNPQTVYLGSDGGLFKCSNMSINPSNPNASIASLSFGAINRNYNVTEFYTLCFSPEVNYVTVSNNNSPMLEGLGLGGGTQDQGSIYINGTLANPNDGVDLSGGDGAGAAVSQLNPNIAYFCSDYGTLLRENNLGVLATPTSAYTSVHGNCIGGNIDSIADLGGACFVFPIALYENSYDFLNRDSLLYIAHKAYAAGDTIWSISNNAYIAFPDTLPLALAAGDTLKIADRVVSRLAIGFSGTQGGIWINGQGASFASVIWMPIGGPLSQPTAFSDNTPVHALAWTNDGNTLFAGCEDGGIYRFTNINSVIANNYCSGALWYSEGGIHPTGNTNIPCIQLTTGLATEANRDVLSIATDPKNINKILITTGNYGETDFVYYCSNAMSATPSFTVVQGNLPAMPVYSAILDILDSNGNAIPTSAMIGTEHGIYTTTNIGAGAGTIWVKNNGGMANVMTQAITQQTVAPWIANNSSVIYAATHGRGLWATNSEYKVIPTALAPITKATVFNLLVYPNPGNGEFTFDFSMPVVGTLEIYDMSGRMIYQKNVQSGKTEINLSQQTNGVYLYKAISNTGSLIGEGKVVKE